MPDARIRDEVEKLAKEFAARVTRLVAEAISDEVDAALSRHKTPRSTEERPRPARKAGARKAAPGVDRWVPDRRARRVPNFVIEATGLRTKKEIVDRYGEHAIFEKGKPAPALLRQ